jgi:hypothetical protein
MLIDEAKLPAFGAVRLSFLAGNLKP